ncbi:MAG: large conductance mechanosensitive channel [Sediminicola sp.]|jgi:large conductance mechanosensitive channel|tara:strand:- start:6911 stop:7342 length:432 start_codon:yes stop_codon:yes gene_type:complete
MKKFFSEFKNFAVKGNMVDMAIGIIMGTAFNNVVNVLVKKIFMPPLLLLTNQVSFTDQKYVLREAAKGSDEISIGYGLLIEVLLDFLIIGLTIFLVVKMMNRFQAKAEDPKDKEVETPKDIQLLSNIEKLMEEQNALLKQRKG